MHGEVEFCSIIRTSILSLNGIPEDGHHVRLDTGYLLGRLAEQSGKKRHDIDWFEKDANESKANGEKRGDEPMDID
jgi:hypothetical protein